MRSWVGLGAVAAAVYALGAGGCVGAEPTAVGDGTGGESSTSSHTSGTGPGSTASSTGTHATTSSSSGATGGGGHTSSGSTSTGAAAGGGGSTPVVPGSPGDALTSGGTISKSASYKLIGAVSESPGGHTQSASPQHKLHTGVLGTTQ
jgi:hypothetical protein